MTYKMMDGSPVTGKTPTDIILAIRGDLWLQEQSLEEYMKGLSERIAIAHEFGKTIRFDTSENCVADLVEVGYLVPTQ